MGALNRNSRLHGAESINELLTAWNSSSTSVVRKALAALDALVPQDRLAPLHEALNGYDFHGGVAVTRELMAYTQTLVVDV